jgi:hypothetical protein
VYWLFRDLSWIANTPHQSAAASSRRTVATRHVSEEPVNRSTFERKPCRQRGVR